MITGEDHGPEPEPIRRARAIRDVERTEAPILCRYPMYDAEGSPVCDLPRLHIWKGVNLGDNHSYRIENILIVWQFTYCWLFHDDEQRAKGWNCIEPVGHVTESLSGTPCFRPTPSLS